MTKLKPVLNSADVDLLEQRFKKVFATKEDIDSIGIKIDKVDKKLDKKFTDLFDYLDKDVSDFRKKVASHLGVDISLFTRTTN